MSNDTQEQDNGMTITNDEISGIVKSSMDAMDNAFNAGIDAAIEVVVGFHKKWFIPDVSDKHETPYTKLISQLTQLKKNTP